MSKVLIVDPALALLADAFRALLPESVEVAATTTFDGEEFARLAADADILVNARRPIDVATLAMAPRVRFVQLIGVGRDTVDVAAAAAAGVVAAYNPGVNAVSVAEHTLMLMLALVKRIPQSERLSRAGRFATAELISTGIGDLSGATVGLVGMGDIGRAVAERLVPFGPRIAYCAASRRPAEVEDRLGVTWSPLPELLRTSSILSLHLPLTAQTRHIIGEAELAAMPAGAYLVNTSRGGLIDEAALRRAIELGHVAGAALDVLEHETAGANPFADMPEVIVTPHVGGGSRGGIGRSVERSAANIRRFLDGQPVVDLVPGLHQTSQ